MDGAAARRVMVVRLDNIGDVLLSGPAVRAVAASGAQVTYLCGPSGRPAAELLPGVDRIEVLAAPWVPLEAPPVVAADLERFVAEVKADPPDEAVILTSYHQSPLPMALLLRLAGVPVIAASSEDHPGSLVDVRRRPEHDADCHEVERSLRLVGDLGYRLPANDVGRLAVQLPSEPRPPPPRPYVVVHPGASVPARGIPVAAGRDLIGRLVAAGHRVVLTGTAAEGDLLSSVAGAPRPEVTVMAGRTTLADLGNVLARASVVVAGNTGTTHLAAAVGTPVVSVFAPVVSLHQWCPWGVPHEVLGNQDIECAGCRARTCPRPGQPCLTPVTGPALMDAASPWLAVDRPAAGAV